MVLSITLPPPEARPVDAVIAKEPVLLLGPEFPALRDPDVPADQVPVVIARAGRIVMGFVDDAGREEGVQDEDGRGPGEEAGEEVAVVVMMPAVAEAVGVGRENRGGHDECSYHDSDYGSLHGLALSEVAR